MPGSTMPVARPPPRDHGHLRRAELVAGPDTGPGGGRTARVEGARVSSRRARLPTHSHPPVCLPARRRTGSNLPRMFGRARQLVVTDPPALRELAGVQSKIRPHGREQSGPARVDADGAGDSPPAPLRVRESGAEARARQHPGDRHPRTCDTPRLTSRNRPARAWHSRCNYTDRCAGDERTASVGRRFVIRRRERDCRGDSGRAHPRAVGGD